LSRQPPKDLPKCFLEALFKCIPQLASRCNAENLVLLINALSYTPFDSLPHEVGTAVAEECMNQCEMGLEIYSVEDLASLFRASWFLKTPQLAHVVHGMLDKQCFTKKAATKVLHAAAQWSKINPQYTSLVDGVLPHVTPSDRIQALDWTSDPDAIIQSVKNELCFLSRADLRACSSAVRDIQAASMIREDFERRSLDANDVLYWLRLGSVPTLMQPLVAMHREDNNILGAACRDALFWEADARKEDILVGKGRLR